MGVVVGLVLGLGLLLVWSAFVLPPRDPRAGRRTPQPAARPARPRRHAVGDARDAGRAVRGRRRRARLRRRAGRLAHRAGGGRVRAAGRLRTLRAGRRAGPSTPARAGRGVAGRRRQPGQRRPRRACRWPRRSAGSPSAGRSPLRPAFARFAREYQLSGRFEECLDRLKERLADPVGDRVVEGLRVAREVGGGDLGRLLRNLSGHLRDDARTRAELEARQSWAVNGARLAVAAPWLVLLLMCFQPEVIARYASHGRRRRARVRRRPVPAGLPRHAAHRPAARGAAGARGGAAS